MKKKKTFFVSYFWNVPDILNMQQSENTLLQCNICSQITLITQGFGDSYGHIQRCGDLLWHTGGDKKAQCVRLSPSRPHQLTAVSGHVWKCKNQQVTPYSKLIYSSQSIYIYIKAYLAPFACGYATMLLFENIYATFLSVLLYHEEKQMWMN